MIERVTLEQEHVMHALEHHEFPDEIISAAPAVAVVLSQSWCPQWRAMQDWLRGLQRRPDSAEPEAVQPASTEPATGIVVWELEYDGTPYFREFLALKEQVWSNRLIPYVRYYRDGRLLETGNYTSAERFLAKLRGNGGA